MDALHEDSVMNDKEAETDKRLFDQVQKLRRRLKSRRWRQPQYDIAPPFSRNAPQREEELWHTIRQVQINSDFKASSPVGVCRIDWACP